MMLLLFLVVVGLVIYVARMSRYGRFGRPWGPQPPTAPGADKAPPEGAQGWFGPYPQPQARPEDEALKVLADRLANGDITPEEYLERVSVLRQQP